MAHSQNTSKKHHSVDNAIESRAAAEPDQPRPLTEG